MLSTAPVPTAGLEVLAAGLPTLALGVVVAGSSAFPGWGTGWLHRFSRAIVLITSISYLCFAAVGEYVLIDGITTGSGLSDADVRLTRNIMVYGLGAVALLFCISVLPRPASTQPGRSPRLVVVGFSIFIALALAIATVGRMTSLLVNPNAMVSLGLLLVVIYVGYEWIFDHYAGSNEGRDARATSRRTYEALIGRTDEFGFPRRGCTLTTTRTNEPVTRAWAARRGDSHVWLEIAAARAVVAHLDDRLLADAPGALRRRAHLQRAVGGRGWRLVIDDVKLGTRQRFPEDRADRRPRHPVGLIPLPIWELAQLGITVTVDQPD